MKEYYEMSAVEALRAAKEKSGMTADEIAWELGVSPAVVNRYLRREDGYLPSLDMIPRLCRVLGNDILLEWLLRRSEKVSTVRLAEANADPIAAMAHAMSAVAGACGIAAGKAALDGKCACEAIAYLEEAGTAIEQAQALLKLQLGTDLPAGHGAAAA